MIVMAPCIIDFIGANALLGPVGGEGALDTPGPLNGIERRNAFAPMKSIMHGAIKIISQ
jgi:hypothetical protein